MREITHTRRTYRASNSTETPRLSYLCYASHPGISEQMITVRYSVRVETGDRARKSPIIKRSIVIAGHKTSVSLEDAFWMALKLTKTDGRVRLQKGTTEKILPA
jgi:ribbon-helix-helix protein